MRAKTDSELRQEAEDAALAERMQHEEAQRDRRHRASAASTRASAETHRDAADSCASVACPTCTFINEVYPIQRGSHVTKCVQCDTVLPSPSGDEAAAGARPAAQHKLEPVECAHCHIYNRIPNQTADALLCGSCFRQLSRTPNAGAGADDPNVAATSANRVIHVLCGQCNKVNELTVPALDSTVQFTCGNCGVLNEAAVPPSE